MTDKTAFYTPSPAADADFVLNGFFRALAEASPAISAAVEVIHERARALEREHADRSKDERSRANLRYACAVLAGYDVLAATLPPQEVVSTLTDAFVRSGASVRDKTLAALDESQDAFRDLVNVSKMREELQFGTGFVLERERDDDDAYLLNVRKCFWHDFFVAVGRPELTKVLCAFDQNWFEVIVPERHGFRFERLTTLGVGGSHCPFHFHRVGVRSARQGRGT
jgi:hypothetical protein